MVGGSSPWPILLLVFACASCKYWKVVTDVSNNIATFCLKF